MERCVICGAPLSGPFCEYCGHKAPVPKSTGQKQASEAPRRTQPAPEPVREVSPYVSPKSRWTAFALCLLFGIFGAHRFYVGKVGTGLLWLFTFGLFGIGYVVDLLLIGTGTFSDSRNLVLKQ